MFSHGLFCPVSGVSTKHDSEAKKAQIHSQILGSFKARFADFFRSGKRCGSYIISQEPNSFFEHAGNQRGRSLDGNFLILDFINHPNFEQSHSKNMEV